MNEQHDDSRRRFVKRAAYVAPAILSLGAVSSVAKAGSSWPRDDEDEDNVKDKVKDKVKEKDDKDRD